MIKMRKKKKGKRYEYMIIVIMGFGWIIKEI